MLVQRFVAFAGGVAALAAGCEAQWFQWTAASGGNDAWYRLTERAGSWVDASINAVALGGQLASVHSAAENQFLASTFLVGDLESRPVWIGLNDAAIEGSFTWSDGSPVDFTNWQSGEPNDYGGNEDFVAINWHHAWNGSPIGTWNDCPLGGTSGFGGGTEGPYLGIVKSAVPAPGGLALVAGVGLMRRRRR